MIIGAVITNTGSFLMIASTKSAAPPEFWTTKQGMEYWSPINIPFKQARLPPTIKFKTGALLVLKSSRRLDRLLPLPSEMYSYTNWILKIDS